MNVDGFVAPGLTRVADILRASLAADEEIGAGFAAIQDGRVLVNIWGGHADRARTRPWAEDTIVQVHSTTKAIASIVMARIVDDGLLSYDDRVADLWPDFAVHGKDALTIAQMMSHQAGLSGFPDPIDPQDWLDPPKLAALLAAQAPIWPPGSASGYHPLTWGYLVGEVARRASGRSLGTLLREDICAPLKIDFQIGVRPEDDHRVAEIRKPSKPANFGEINPARRAAFFTPWASAPRDAEQWRRVEIPSANGHGTALSVAQLCSVLACGGRIGSMRVLSPIGYAELTRPRISGPDLVLPFDVDWRAGVLGNAQGFYGPNRGAFGHSGSGGSCGFGDPVTKISVGYVMNKQSPFIMGDPRSLKLIEALYACL